MTVKSSFPMSDYPHSTKEQVKQQLIVDGFSNPVYSGKDKCFYADGVKPTVKKKRKASMAI